MASAVSVMDDSFKNRVDKIFGSLAPLQSSPWTLTDDAVEKREWKRDEKKDASNRDETPCSSSFDELLRNRRRSSGWELEDDDGDDDGCRATDRDELEIRSSIGLDNTLDNEEEEDEFDKVASGRENAGERLYMNEVNDRGPYLNMHNVLPKSLSGARKDPRANHQAAISRLKEDEAEGQGMNSNSPNYDTGIKDLNVNISESTVPLKPILKRKENNVSSKPQKRVRFDPACKIDCDEAVERYTYSSYGTSSSDATDLESATRLPKEYSEVPDYLQNPSNYTRYSFDTSNGFNEGSNTKDRLELLKVVKSRKALGPEQHIASGDPPTSVTFIPKKKMGDYMAANASSEIKDNKKNEGESFFSRSRSTSGIAERESQEDLDGAVEEMVPETKATDDDSVSNKPRRRYRKPSRSDNSDS